MNSDTKQAHSSMHTQACAGTIVPKKGRDDMHTVRKNADIYGKIVRQGTPSGVQDKNPEALQSGHSAPHALQPRTPTSPLVHHSSHRLHLDSICLCGKGRRTDRS